MPLAAGTRLGPYEILSPIGKGGMGEVYRARDTRLGRDVAIKVSTERFSERFAHEARAIASLNHPNICILHDVGPDYIVMELVEGLSLKGPLPLETVIEYARQICSALQAAHEKGIVHRDLKPGNIMVTKGTPARGGAATGTIKLLDFGLAKVTHAFSSQDETVTETRAGTIVGSAAYMSPEQAEGKLVDARSDIFSLGIVLYELIAGHRPFIGGTAMSTMAAIMREEPPSLDAPEDISRMVMRCLAKRPADRFQTAAELNQSLHVAQPGSTVPSSQPSIAVLPFADMSPGKDNEYFSDGMAEEIINALTRIPNFKVIARTSAFAFKGKQEDIRKIAGILGVANILEGSVRLAGNRVRIAAQLIGAADGGHLWSERFDRDMSDIFAIQDEISQAIADALKAKLGPRPEPAARPTVNVEAYQAYLEGNHYLAEMTPAGMARSLECYQRAVRLDPSYAAPLAAICERALYQALYIGARPRDVLPDALAAVNRALELNPECAEAYHIRGMVRTFYEWNWSGAEKDVARTLQLNPAFALAHVARANILVALRRNQEAVAEMRQALELDPLNAITRRAELFVLYATGNGELAVERARSLVDLFGASWVSWAFAARALILQGLLAEADAALQKGLELSPGNVHLLAWLALARGRQGRVSDAERIRAVMDASAAQQYVPFWLRAAASEGCGDMEQAFRYMDQSLEERELNAPIWLIGRRTDLSADPRYQAQLRRINLA